MKIIKIEMTDSELLDILTDSIETGSIDYWAVIKKVYRDVDGRIFKVEIVNREDVMDVRNIMSSTINLGIEKIMCDEVSTQYIRKMILDEDIDSVGGDVIIQAGLFGKIVYS